MKRRKRKSLSKRILFNRLENAAQLLSTRMLSPQTITEINKNSMTGASFYFGNPFANTKRRAPIKYDGVFNMYHYYDILEAFAEITGWAIENQPFNMSSGILVCIDLVDYPDLYQNGQSFVIIEKYVHEEDIRTVQDMLNEAKRYEYRTVIDIRFSSVLALLMDQNLLKKGPIIVMS